MEVKATSRQTGQAFRRKAAGQGRESRKPYTDRNGKSGHVTPAIVEKYLGGMHYPSEKAGLLKNARTKKAPDDVVNLINKLTERTYKSPIDVTKKIGKIE